MKAGTRPEKTPTSLIGKTLRGGAPQTGARHRRILSAILFRAGDSCDMARALQTLIENPDMASPLSASAREMIATKYASDVARQAYSQILALADRTREAAPHDLTANSSLGHNGARTSPSSNSVLLMNFYSGVLNRGIPLYTDNLAAAFERAGVRCAQLTCPRALLRLPRPVLDGLFVLCEQIAAPLVGLRFACTIYPYNSVSVLSTVFGRPAVVIHDYIRNSRRDSSLAARYVRTTQRLHSMLGRDVIYISRRVETLGQRAKLFPRSRTYLFPNAFYRLAGRVRQEIPTKGAHVLLCTGWGANKDLAGSLALYYNSGLWRMRRLRILGISGHEDEVNAFCSRHAEMAEQIAVLPRLEDGEVVNEYCEAAWVWVHSKKEGYGRSIAEARLCGSRVVASNIAPFREQADDFTFLYSGLNDFKRAVSLCEASNSVVPRRVPHEHEVLQSEIRRFMNLNE